MTQKVSYATGHERPAWACAGLPHILDSHWELVLAERIARALLSAAEACSPQCLLARPTDVCRCICQGRNHAAVYHYETALIRSRRRLGSRVGAVQLIRASEIQIRPPLVDLLVTRTGPLVRAGDGKATIW